MSLRQEFTELAVLEGANIRRLARQYNISPTTAYKWIDRFNTHGAEGLKDRSRRPLNSPRRTDGEIEASIILVRKDHPAWGARKIHHYLLNQGATCLPAVSTINAILKRHNLLDSPRPQRDLIRFERGAPNELWQMDFKGYFQTATGDCYPFTSLDDHSRFALGIFACGSEGGKSVRAHLTTLFRKYGLPRTILCDNGNPWGSSSKQCPITQLGIWLFRLGVDVTHGRPWHPQTQGKLERFHRSLKAEVLQQPHWHDLDQCQRAFDNWRSIYNEKRPHESLDGHPPISRYQISTREMPSSLPALEYDEGVTTRRVNPSGTFSFKNRLFYAGRAFQSYRLGIIPIIESEIESYEIRFGWKTIGQINLTPNPPPKGAGTISIWNQQSQRLRCGSRSRI